MIGVVDIGSGNLRSVLLAVRKCGGRARVVSDALQFRKCSALILPGVGSFEVLRGKSKQLRALREFAADGKPLLGICLGMQALFERSEEAPGVKGLGLLRGSVRRICGKVRLPQMGWNRLKIRRRGALLAGAEDGMWAYFANSFACYPKSASIISASVVYGPEFSVAVESGNVFGVQFHPEKSGEAGLQVLRNFVQMVRKCA